MYLKPDEQKAPKVKTARKPRVVRTPHLKTSWKYSVRRMIAQGARMKEIEK